MGLTETQKVRSPFEQNSDHVADGWYQLRFGGYTRGGVGAVGFDEGLGFTPIIVLGLWLSVGLTDAHAGKNL